MTSLRLSNARAALAAALSLQLLAPLPGLADTPAPESTYRRTVLNREHVDLVSFRYEEGELFLMTRADLEPLSITPEPPMSGVERRLLDPEEVIFHLPDQLSSGGLIKTGGRQIIPAGEAFAFLGDAGETVWVAPEQHDQTPFIFAGFETESLGDLFEIEIETEWGPWAGSAVRLHLDEVLPPTGGALEIFSGRLTGEPDRWFSSHDDAYATRPFATGGHEHANWVFTAWVFTALGTYVLTFRATTALEDGTPLESEPRRLPR